MNKYIAKDNERLDSVVYRFYGSLEYFSMVLEANPKLNPLLKKGWCCDFTSNREKRKQRGGIMVKIRICGNI